MSIKRVVLSAAILFVIGIYSPGRAQVLPGNMGIDSSLRMELLMGRQTTRTEGQPIGQISNFIGEYDLRLPVISGTVEFSPLPSLSGRISGATSLFNNSGTVYRANGTTTSGYRWSVRRDYKSWDVGGLYHFWIGGGYRFSGTAGFRRETWQYNGDPQGDSNPSTSLEDEATSNIPYLGMQTAMFFPWWKARFEFIGSPFAGRLVRYREKQPGTVLEYDLKADPSQGGMLEVRMEGTAGLTSNLLLGLNARYTYQEFYGQTNSIVNIPGSAPSPYPVYFGESIFVVGLNGALVF